MSLIDDMNAALAAEANSTTAVQTAVNKLLSDVQAQTTVAGVRRVVSTWKNAWVSVPQSSWFILLEML